MPLSLDEPLVYMEGQPTLRDAIKNFVDGWNFAHELSANPGEYAEYRRAYAGLVAAAAKSARKRRGLLQ